MAQPRALITGITGQDGRFLTAYLTQLGYAVHGVVRHVTQPDAGVRAELLQQGVTLHEGDMLDQSSLSRIVALVQPTEVYNLAAQSFVKLSWEQPELTAEINASGTRRLLEACRRECPQARFYQASTSELFGNSPAPQNEATPFAPRSPYATAKLTAHYNVINYRESYGMHASCGILFNHESELRGKLFVTRKITSTLAAMLVNPQAVLELGNLDASRDWGHAEDYVKAMHTMLQRPIPQEYVIATGETHTVEEFLQLACAFFQISRDSSRIRVNPELFRPAEVNTLCGDATKAKEELGFKPRVTFKELVRRMCVHDAQQAGLRIPGLTDTEEMRHVDKNPPGQHPT